MFSDIISNVTLPGAYTKAVMVAKERDLAERRRLGGYTAPEAPAMKHRTVLQIMRNRIAGMFKGDRRDPEAQVK
ncbi:MAG: hypothetical protein AAGA28_08325 [Pseudomonadota bacterium]